MYVIMKQNIFWVIVGTFVSVIAFVTSNGISYGQITQDLTSQPFPNETVKIVSPIESQQIPVGKELIVSGQSTDDNTKNLPSEVK